MGEGEGGGGTGFILVGTKLSKRVSVLVTELYTGLELPCNRETLSQQFGTVNGNARPPAGLGLRYTILLCKLLDRWPAYFVSLGISKKACRE